jgi:hypothetical protein
MSNFQRVYDDGIQWDGNTGTLVVKYDSSSATTGGLGLLVRYDSNSMKVVDSTATTFGSEVVIGPNDVVGTEESGNFDSNVNIAWASFFGDWPGVASGDLAVITFEKIPGGNNYAHDYGYTSNQDGFDFIADPYLPLSVQITPVDENSDAGAVVATTSGGPSGATYSLVDNTDYGQVSEPVENVTSVPEQVSDAAHVFVSDISTVGSQLIVQISYLSDKLATGLGLNVHYDSAVLGVSGQPSVNSHNAMIIGPDLSNDGVVGVNYVSLGAPWPTSTNPEEIVTLTFDILDTTATSSEVTFSASSVPPAMTGGFLPQSQTIQLPPPDPSELTIDPESGEVTLIVSPDFEQRNEYSFDVVATADSTSATSENNDVVLVNNLDEESAIITSGDTAVAIDENSGAGQVIYTATADDSADVSDGVSFSLAEGSDAALSIDADTGAVTLNTDPDHETQSQYSFSVIATDAAGNLSSAQSVTLDINDVDDTAPTITSGDTAVAIDENSGSDQVVYTATADDSADVSDEPISFSLSADSDTALSIDASTGEVTLTADPDHETQSQYSFSVIATDAAGNESSAQLVTLDINNVDDTAPVITSGDTANAIDENSGAGQVVYTVQAHDDPADTISEPLTYSLFDDSNGEFTIDASGNVSLVSNPDFESVESYTFVVRATDGDGNYSDQAVTLDVNDIFDINPVVPPQSGSVDENSPLSYQVQASVDPKAGDYGIGDSLSYELTDNGGMFAIDQEGVVTFAGDYADYEQSQNLSFTVKVTDDGDNSTERTINIEVQNLDEIAPTITSDSVADAIDENEVVDVIYTATADDSLDTSAGVTFSLSDDSDSALSIDSTTGEVSISGPADYETQSIYSFTVIASDGVNEDVEQVVTLDINNLDELGPIFESGDTADAIDENSGAGQVVYTASAQDDGSDVTSEPLTYSLSDDSNGSFDIDAATGVVTLVENPDFEAQSQYSFTVVATDEAGNSSQQSVSLDINNLDELAPIFDSGDTANAIDENSGAGQLVYTASAQDDGSDETSEPLTYSLSDDSNGAFEIDPVTGDVTLNDDPNFEDAESYSFTVKATDGSGNSSLQSVSLAINNQDELSPIISAPEVAPTLSSFSSENQTVYVSNAIDDSGIDGNEVTSEPLSYALKDYPDFLAEGDLVVDPVTGEVTYTPMPFTNETLLEVPYTVTVTDTAGNESDVELQFNISGKEFNVPLFDVAEGFNIVSTGSVVQNEGTEYEVFENVVTAVSGSLDSSVNDGSVIYTAVVDDATPVTFALADAASVAENSEHNQIVYSAVSSGHLSVDVNSGAVTINGTPWVDGAEEYTFAVIATDSSGNQSRQDVTLAVNDYAVAPKQADGDVTYSLVDGHDESIQINPQTGQVYLLDSANYEDNAQYQFTVVIDDNGVSREQAVVVDTVNTDDVAPTVESGDSASSVDENSGAGQVVYTASADDSIDGSGVITYSLTEESDPALSIDATSGQVTLDVNPDYEGQSSYSFAVVATDNAGNSSEPKSVSLSIGDKDEINPVISSAATASVNENIGGDQVIYNAVASDPVAQKERGPIAVEFDQNSDGVVTLKLFVEESLAGQFANELQGIQFNLNYSADSFAAIALENIDYTSSPFVSAVSESEGTLGVALTYLPAEEAPIAGFDLYDAVSTVAIAELSFNVGSAASNLDFSVSDVGIIEYGVDLVTHPSGQSVYELDLDNSDVTYALADGHDSALSIDAISGAVSLSDNPDFESQAEYSFTVVATDSSDNTVSQDVTVTVNNRDEWDPSITSNDEASQIIENSGADQVVYTAEVDDALDISEGVKFALRSDSDSDLTIDSETGKVSLRVNPDSDDKDSYSFTVIATDEAGRSSEKLVTLDVKNLDESAPTITSSTTHSVDENYDTSMPIYTAVATDGEDVSAGVNFSLSLDSDPSLFIDSQSGEVRLLTAADFESQSKYNFTVIATDKAGNASEQAVTLRLNDLDEQAPSITSEVEVSVFENVDPGHIVYRASADDSADISAGLSYALGSDSDTALSIDAESGAVTLNHSPDFEAQSSYEFTVIVTDGVHSSTQAVTLVVNDVDEAAPIFADSEVVSITENSGIDNIIYTAAADDSAEVTTGVTFSLAEGSDAGLSIDPETGAVKLAHNADFEAKDSYSFTVVARDAEGNEAGKSVSVAIDSLTHVDVTHWSGGVGIASADVTLDDKSVSTDSAGRVTDQSATATANVGVSKVASEADKKAIDVGDALAALRLSTENNVDSDSFDYLSADIDGNNSVSIVDVLSILKFAAGVEDNSNSIGQWSFRDNPVNTNDNDSYAFTGYLLGDVDGSWGTYSARTAETKEVTIHVTEDSSAQSVFKYDARAMDVHSIGEGLSVAGGVISLASDLNYEERSSMSFTLRDKSSGELLVHNVKVGNVDESAPEFVSDAAISVDSGVATGDVIYTAVARDSSDASAGVKYRFENQPEGLEINPYTGDVSIQDEAANIDGYSFTVLADDGVNPVSSQAVTVSLETRDTVKPTMASERAVTISEVVDSGDVIFTAEATDDQAITYSLARGSDKAVQINAETGEVSLVRGANFEHQEEYAVTVIARDAEGNLSKQLVTINVDNRDEVAPKITSLDEAASINENSGANQSVYTATAIDDSDKTEGVTFSLSLDSDSALSIDADTGEVVLSDNPDHEVQSQYVFTVVATDAANNSSEKTVTLEISDLDDANPVITSGDDVSSINENSGAYQVIYTASADDSVDMSRGVKFRLSEDSDPALKIDPVFGNVVLRDNPDHETQSAYSFTVIAVDASGNTVEKSLTIDINDLDDTAPVITSADTATAIDENSGSDQVIYTATADDSADVQAAPISFSLTADSDKALEINSDTGDVTLTSNPDHEIQDQYSFTVVASDGAGNVSDEQSVTLQINDTDEANPIITVENSVASLEENSGAGQTVFTVSASDIADFSSGSVTLELSSDSDSGLQLTQSGDVILLQNPDAEAKDQYSFTIIASDDAGKLATVSHTVSIVDIDEEAPTFTSGGIADAINENSAPADSAYVVYTAQADGNDNALGDEVSYSLLAGHDPALAINAVTGEVVLLINPDADAPNSDQYSFTVVAKDNAGLSSEQSVVLVINNIDDTAPVLTSDNSASITENSANLLVYTATADDSINAIYGEVSTGVSFSLAEGSDSALSIDSETGDVTLSSAPDFEAQDSYSFTVVAADAFASVSKEVTVSVVNLDEVAPVISSGFAGEVVVENSASGQVVYTASATDTDFNDGENITFAFVGDHHGFEINEATGVVTTTADLQADYEAQSQHSFIITATDDSNNVSVGKPVTVVIGNVDDTAPEITSASSAGSVVEETGAGQVVYTATADDSADVSEGDVTFSLVGDSDSALSIDSESGVVTLNADPDYENQEDYAFTVRATDSAGNFSDKTVTLDVINNPLDDDGVSVPNGLVSPINENSGSNQVVYTAGAVNGVTYSLGESSDSALTINSVTGTVVLGENPDADAKGSYQLTVIASNVLGDTAEGNFTLEVTDIDDAAPVITSDSEAIDMNIDLEGDLDENSDSGQIIYVAQANDNADDIIDGDITFSLAPGHSPDLEISANGIVKLNVSPDYETQSQYSFTVVATDGAGNSSEQAVTLDVRNLDDTAAVITSGDSATAIIENSGAQQLVYTATADDSADIQASPITFSLTDDSDSALSIDAVSGEVTLSTNPDHETQSQYNFAVVATDVVGNVSDAQSVTLDIVDADDTAPVIVSGQSAGTVSANSGENQVIYTVITDDSADVSDGAVSYSLSDDSNGAFSIDPLTGAVTLIGQPVYDAANDTIGDGNSVLNFTVVATDSAENISESQTVTLQVALSDIDAPVFTSSQEDSVNENGSFIYAAAVSDASNVSYALRNGSDLALEIDSVTGVVSLKDGVADYEAQNQYEFGVDATDEYGNTSSQLVTVTINNEDEVAPEITSTENIIITEGDSGAIYTASASDSDFNGEEVINFSLSSDSDNFSINNGVVSLVDSALSDASFTLIATDAAGNQSQQTVNIAVASQVSGSDQSEGNIGAIGQRFSQNADGSYNLQLFVADENAPSLIDNMDFRLTFDAADIEGGQLTINQPSANPLFNMVNNDIAGQVEVAQIYFPFAYSSSDQLSILDVTFDLAEDVANTSFAVDQVLFNGNADFSASSSFELVNVAQVDGSSDSDVFSLEGGPANVVSGAGEDIYVITGGVDTDVVIDLVSGQDSIELGSELAAAGYDADSDLLQVAGDTPNLADLIESNSHDLDNAFGAYLDDSANVLTMFIDSDVSDSVNIKQYEVTLAEGSSFDDDDLSADLSLFIA